MDDESAAKLIDAVAMHRNIADLMLGFNDIVGRQWIMALGNLLQKPASQLVDLNIGHNSIGNEAAAVLGNALAKNKTLEDLDLDYNAIGDEGAAALGNSLADNKTLKNLSLQENRNITTTGWTAFARCLFNSSLEVLGLSGNTINDEGATTLSNALANNVKLTELDLSNNLNITSSGWMAMSSLLQQPNSSLEIFCLSSTGNHITDEVAIAFANALVNNTSLRWLQFGDDHAITTRGWTALSSTLCDKSSIERIYSSNHTLEGVGWEPGELASSLQLNRNNNKAEVARQKILQYHFSGGNTKVEEFVNMKMKVLPQAMSWIGRDVEGFLLLYQVVHSMPTLFDFDSQSKSVSGKRKRN